MTEALLALALRTRQVSRIRQVHYSCRMCAIFICCLVASKVTIAQTGLAPQSDETRIGPVNFTARLENVPIEIPVLAYVSTSSSPSGLAVHARIVAELDNLQS